MTGLAASALVVLALWVSGADAAAFQENGSLRCSKFGRSASVCTKELVYGTVGGFVLLPCTFGLRSNENRARVQWKRPDGAQGRVVVFDGARNFTRRRFKGRLWLVGRASRGEAHISIGNLSGGDANTYFCDITEWSVGVNYSGEYIYSDPHGTRLLVRDEEQDVADRQDGETMPTDSDSRADFCKRSAIAVSICSIAILVVSLAVSAHVVFRERYAAGNKKVPV
ncbi:uncharacterized protein LOC144737680 [Lampetra planeri]